MLAGQVRVAGHPDDPGVTHPEIAEDPRVRHADEPPMSPRADLTGLPQVGAEAFSRNGVAEAALPQLARERPRQVLVEQEAPAPQAASSSTSRS